uniref:Vitellogenin domain-containing protein n=1 Tax=Anopheles minimus TaxID=112268 RepID=A0A182VSW7_9DIPT
FGYVAPAFGDAFNVGTEETFAFSNVVQIGNAKNATVPFGYRTLATVIVGSVWGNEETKLLKIQIQKPELLSIPDDKIGVIVGMESPFYAWWNLGRIRELYFATSDTVPVKNLKKGVCALFQYQLLDGTFTEDDPSGQCEAKYISHSSTRYHKSKGNCHYDAKRMERHEYALRSSLKTSRSTDYTVSTEGALQKVTSQDYVKYLLNAHDQIGAYYESIMQLNVQGSAQKTATVEGSSIEAIVKQLGLERETLLTQEFYAPCKDNCDSVISLFKHYKKSLSNGNVGKEASATALVDMVQVARNAKKEDLVRMLKAKSSNEIKGQLLDLLGAIQTVASHEAAKTEFLTDTEDEQMFLGERYLQALAVSTRPQKEIVEDLLRMAQTEHRNVKFYDSLIQSMAAVTRRYAQLEGNSYETEVVTKVIALLEEKLDECSNDSCKLKYIRGFQNLKCPKTVDKLLKLAQESTKVVSVAAMKALRTFSVYLWNDEFRVKFEDIFFQVSKRYDSSARTLALDILLDMKPDYDELSHLLQFLKSSDKAYEVKQYLLQKLRMLAEQCNEFAMMLKGIIEHDPVLNNYHVLVPRGLSTALSRKFSTVPSFNASLTSLQEMSGGVLKRGIVDLTLDVDNERTSLFTLGLYAGGMSSFVSNNDEDANDAVEEEDTTAGMELLVQGVAMRPLEFFNGKGELMGHVWSGTASEPTPAYQAITLLQDSEERFASHNGVTLTLSSTGAISIDLNGQVTMSLWGRNAQSKVEQNTGISMTGRLSFDTSFATVNVRFSVEQEPQLHLTSALDFSGDPALCMQLLQPKSSLKQRFAKTIELVGTQHRASRKTIKTVKLNGLTHSLNRKNNDMCNLISKS